MNRHFRRGDSSKWGRTSTAIRENVRRTGGRARVEAVLLARPRCQKSGSRGPLLPWRHLTRTGFPELPGGLDAERIAGVDQR